MRKALTYSSFAITSLLVVLVFITATTYSQLGLAIAIYPLIIFFAYKLFIVKKRIAPQIAYQPPPVPPVIPAGQTETESTKLKMEDVSISDIDKRAFLKVIGATGLSFLLFSLLNRRADSLFLGGQSTGTGIASLTNDEGTKISPAERHPTDGFQISEIDDRDIVFYGFINTYGAWYIMREEDDGSFRYAKGESDFPTNWDRRDGHTYDYYHRVF